MVGRMGQTVCIIRFQTHALVKIRVHDAVDAAFDLSIGKSRSVCQGSNLFFYIFFQFFSWYSTGDDAHISCFFSCKTSACHKKIGSSCRTNAAGKKNGTSHIRCQSNRRKGKGHFCVFLCNGKVTGHGKAHSAACAGTFDPGNYRLFNLADVKD